MSRFVKLSHWVAAMVLFAVGAVTAQTYDTRRITVGTGEVIEVSNSVDRIFVADPSVADVEAISRTSIYIFGVQTGETVVTMVDEANQVVATIRATVVRSATGANRAAGQLGLDTGIGVVYLGDRPVVSGEVRTPEMARRVDALVGQLDGDTSTVDLTEYIGENQVRINLRIAEIQSVGLQRTGLRFDPSNDFGLLDALVSQGFAQILAEPTLVTASGTTASFLSGGEFAYESSNDDAGVGFREFGVKLEFTPTIVDSHTVLLEINSEVSTPTASAIDSSSSDGIGGRQIRNVRNTVELKNADTYVIASLFQQNSDLSRSNVPLLSELPLVGDFFRSGRFETSENELVVFVTPEILPRGYRPTEPTEPSFEAPQVTDLVGFTVRPGLTE